MKRTALALTLVLALLISFVAGAWFVKPSMAETITVPDDYSTIQDAINAANEGDRIFVKKGTYEEQTLEINKTLSLIGEDANNTKITLHPPYNETRILTAIFRTYANAITIDANNVELSNLTIIGNGGDISATGDRTHIIGNNIAADLSVDGSHSKIIENTITSLSVSGSNNNIAGNNINEGSIRVKGSFNVVLRNYVSVEIALEYGDSNTVSNNTCERFRLGLDNHTCSYNIISGNKIDDWIEVYLVARGISIGSGSHNVFYDNIIANFNRFDGYGLWFDGSGAENNTFYHNTFVNNTKQVGFSADSSGNSNVWDSGREGNFWSDYNGTDDNRDGIGDTPYVIDDANIDNYPLMAPYDVENDAVVLPPPEPCPTTTVVAVSASMVVVAIGVLVYFKKRTRYSKLQKGTRDG
jgi:hypothetical protein